MSIEARQIQETLYSYAAILNFTPSPQGLRAKFGACSVQNAQLLRLSHISVCSIYVYIRQKEKIPDSYDKCEPVLIMPFEFRKINYSNRRTST